MITYCSKQSWWRIYPDVPETFASDCSFPCCSLHFYTWTQSLMYSLFYLMLKASCTVRDVSTGTQFRVWTRTTSLQPNNSCVKSLSSLVYVRKPIKCNLKPRGITLFAYNFKICSVTECLLFCINREAVDLVHCTRASRMSIAGRQLYVTYVDDWIRVL
jgi:hypothetical protein